MKQKGTRYNFLWSKIFLLEIYNLGGREMKVMWNGQGSIEHICKHLDDGRKEMSISLKPSLKAIDEKVVITTEWNFPVIDIAGRWHPVCKFDRSLRADWSYGDRVMSSISAPVIAFFNEEGKNRGTFAVSETKKEVKMKFGVHEEDGTMKCVIEIQAGILEEKEYQIKILMDERDVAYEEALRGVTSWWKEECQLQEAMIPKSAKEPMYSFWYSFHQQFTAEEIEEECCLAKEMGFETVIVDDGWQTDDTNRGYGYCGDWKVAEGKIKDMKQHVQKVHGMGMKYLLWFSVPYVGYYSKMWNLFHDKLIAVDEEQKTGILDIRYQEVREYLKNIYVTAIKEWDLDGLKLDFIDEFYERESTPKSNDKMDCSCLQEALNLLLQETMVALKAIKEDVLIEFRQRYIGPTIRQYGNILRVGDCPNSGISNRVGIIDLRLLSGNTAVHSDMVMWNQGERAEEAALQIISCLFGTLQFSVRLDRMTEEQKRMVQNYMKFAKQHKDVLQEAPIEAKEPHNLYPEVRGYKEAKEVIVCYSGNRVVSVRNEYEKTIIVNGTKVKSIVVKMEKEEERQVTVMDCFGNVLKQEQQLLTGIQEIPCPVGGRIELFK